ncbi:MAG: hypothetical protein KF685_12335 [Acidobacteria bacterium]|nr:hypothetical protein [Acidobacteriota bacterium]
MKWFDISDELLPKLRQLQEQDPPEKRMESEDAVMMFAGLGDPMYLTFDGRVLIVDMLEDVPPREAASFQEAVSAIIIGAKKRKCPELFDLLPMRGENAADCNECDKSGWQRIAETITIVCENCGGLGWK